MRAHILPMSLSVLRVFCRMRNKKGAASGEGSNGQMTQQEVLKDIRARLEAKHGDRLRGVVLYGSEARGEARADSDIDVLVLLNGPVDYGRDLETNLDALYPLSLQIGRRISAKPADVREYEIAACPLYQHVRTEGVAV